MPDYSSYQKSISMELRSEKDRVRHFIDDHHWGEDGRYKEAILKDCIRNKLPDSVKIGTGFVVGDHERLTSQIDLIVYRSEIPVLFKKDDFVILPKEAVLGIIEVKTRLDTGKIREVWRKSHENGQIIGRHIFNGIFIYECDRLPNRYITRSERKNYSGYINNVAFGPDYFIKYWEDGQPRGERGEKYRIYALDNLSFGYFISNLVEDVFVLTQNKRISDVLSNMFYPIEGTKEAHIYDTILVDPNDVE